MKKIGDRVNISYKRKNDIQTGQSIRRVKIIKTEEKFRKGIEERFLWKVR